MAMKQVASFFNGQELFLIDKSQTYNERIMLLVLSTQVPAGGQVNDRDNDGSIGE